eukprot:2020363-Amphidinium_carterae.1
MFMRHVHTSPGENAHRRDEIAGHRLQHTSHRSNTLGQPQLAALPSKIVSELTRFNGREKTRTRLGKRHRSDKLLKVLRLFFHGYSHLTDTLTN